MVIHNSGFDIHSPKHDTLKAITRFTLLPIIGLSWAVLKLGPIATLTMMMIFGAGLVYIWMLKRD